MNIGFRMGVLGMVVIFYTTTIGSQSSGHCELQDPTQYTFIRGALLNFATVHWAPIFRQQFANCRGKCLAGITRGFRMSVRLILSSREEEMRAHREGNFCE
jgi:hypothetical protein